MPRAYDISKAVWRDVPEFTCFACDAKLGAVWHEVQVSAQDRPTRVVVRFCRACQPTVSAQFVEVRMPWAPEPEVAKEAVK